MMTEKWHPVCKTVLPTSSCFLDTVLGDLGYFM